jgi:hypothetical protein
MSTTPDTTPDPTDAEIIEYARVVGLVEPEKAPAFMAAYQAAIKPCEQHPDAPRIGGMCGGCTIVPDAAPLTMADRNAHAVSLYARTAVELEDARADAANLRTMYNAAEARTNDLIEERDKLSALVPVLSDSVRQFLGFALDQAAAEMASYDGFTDDDEQALAVLRRLAAEEQGR